MSDKLPQEFLDLIREYAPNKIALDLVGVQPMAEPVWDAIWKLSTPVKTQQEKENENS